LPLRDISIFLPGASPRASGSPPHRVVGGSVDVSAFALQAPTFLLAYATIDFPLPRFLETLRRSFPRTPIFGCTSYRGVFSREGFFRGAALLAGERADGLQVASVARRATPTDARDKARVAVGELVAALQDKPRMILMHATPGFEERIVEGIESALGRDVAIFGGSAADDSIAGDWHVFEGTTVLDQGFVLAAFASRDEIHGGFLGGYLPTDRSGRVTRSEGRKVLEIDDRPAALVYNEWTGGVIADEIKKGGVVLLKTNLQPVGRVVDESMGVPMRVLCHPHEVVGSALTFFAEIPAGENITLMLGSQTQLMSRMEKVVRRAVAGRQQLSLKGGFFVYCGGSLGVVLDRAPEISREFASGTGDIPFVGVATFGEQGCFIGKRKANRHGNLMCSAVLFAGGKP
jgi:hypothetical protein